MLLCGYLDMSFSLKAAAEPLSTCEWVFFFPLSAFYPLSLRATFMVWIHIQPEYFHFSTDLSLWLLSQDLVITGLLRNKNVAFNLLYRKKKQKKRAISVKYLRLLHECCQFKCFCVLIGLLWYSGVVVYFGVMILFPEPQGHRSPSRWHPDHRDICIFGTNCRAYETKEVK